MDLCTPLILRFYKNTFMLEINKMKLRSIRARGIKGPNKELRGYREVYIGMVVSLCQRGIVFAILKESI